jgi:hypothetical protein
MGLVYFFYFLYKQHNFQTAPLVVQDVKACGGGVTLAPLIANGALLGFGEWSVECVQFSTPGERAADTTKIS